MRQQSFHDKLKHEFDIVEGFDTEASVAFIEELMCRGADVVEVLRLMVLLNECHQGKRGKICCTFGPGGVTGCGEGGALRIVTEERNLHSCEGA